VAALGEVLAEHQAGAMEDRVVRVALRLISVGGASGPVLSGAGGRFVPNQPRDPSSIGERGP
jgi:hypothetical protein